MFAIFFGRIKIMYIKIMNQRQSTIINSSVKRRLTDNFRYIKMLTQIRDISAFSAIIIELKCLL